MVKMLIFALVFGICAAGYYYYYAGQGGVLDGQSYDEAREEFADMRPAETVWTPEEQNKMIIKEKQD